MAGPAVRLLPPGHHPGVSPRVDLNRGARRAQRSGGPRPRTSLQRGIVASIAPTSPSSRNFRRVPSSSFGGPAPRPRAPLRARLSLDDRARGPQLGRTRARGPAAGLTGSGPLGHAGFRHPAVPREAARIFAGCSRTVHAGVDVRRASALGQRVREDVARCGLRSRCVRASALRSSAPRGSFAVRMMTVATCCSWSLRRICRWPRGSTRRTACTCQSSKSCPRTARSRLRLYGHASDACHVR